MSALDIAHRKFLWQCDIINTPWIQDINLLGACSVLQSSSTEIIIGKCDCLVVGHYFLSILLLQNNRINRYKGSVQAVGT